MCPRCPEGGHHVSGGDVYLVGDMLAAPGLLGEVSLASALTAVHAIGDVTIARRTSSQAV
jgi:hypothetical protein